MRVGRPEELRGPGVRGISRMVGGMLFPQYDSHQVVRTGPVITILHLRGDFVVGLGDYLWNRNPAGVIAEGTEWLNMGHG